MKHLAVLGSVAFGLSLMASTALAQSCTAYPNTLTNGTTADATQVMANFNCAALLGGANFTGPITATGTGSIVTIQGQSGALTQHAFQYKDYAGNVLFSVSDWNGSYSGEINISAPPSQTAGSGINFNSGGSKYGLFQMDGGGNMVFRAESSGAGMYFDYNSAGLYFRDVASGYATRLFIATGGNVGIGTTTPTYLLQVGGTAYATAWNTPSDSRLKDHVAAVTNGLDLLKQLRPVRFGWIAPDKRTVGKDLKLPTGEPQVGFIAQEVEKIVPEAVKAPSKGGADSYSMNESSLIPILTAAIKEQQTEIEALKAEVAALETGSPHHKRHS